MPRQKTDRLPRVIVPLYFKTLIAQNEQAATPPASPRQGRNPKKRLRTSSTTPPQRDIQQVAVPLSPPPTIAMPFVTSPSPSVEKTHFETQIDFNITEKLIYPFRLRTVAN
ncbi:hypothetical protein KIN20_022914 [Parelaphostrongylus tenuis]|uniref:Uncharacterized protein n=1 Tax=Parelaphostrongylus tenuis TaxID=148309 RepID=A0AAD5QVP2_PARTN|nr:hypothetical protein KIN20_022914 [Parelaphostrongylus tenuis]